MDKDYMLDVIDTEDIDTDEIDTKDLETDDFFHDINDDNFDIMKLNTKEKKRISRNIMKKYNEGKNIAEPYKAIIREILNMDKGVKLPNIIIRKVTTDEKDQEAYDFAVKEYNRGMQMTLAAKEELLLYLDKFIYYVIERNFPTFKTHTKDLYQEGVIGILKGIDTYDANLSLPTTYFFVFILHEMTEYINLTINKTTSHYAASMGKIKKAIGHFEKSGREWTITDIAQETGISAETIQQTLRIMEYSNEKHYESADHLDTEINPNMVTPEVEYIKKEENEILYEAIKSLPKNEADVIILKFCDGLSYKSISEVLELPIDQVKRCNNKAIRKLRMDRRISKDFSNLAKEDKAINGKDIGVIPISTGEDIMELLLKADDI